VRRLGLALAPALAVLAVACQTEGGFVEFDPCCKKPYEDAYPGNEIRIETCTDGHSCEAAAERLTRDGWILVEYGRRRADVGASFAYVWRRPKPTPTPRPTSTPRPAETPSPAPSASS